MKKPEKAENSELTKTHHSGFSHGRKFRQGSRLRCLHCPRLGPEALQHPEARGLSRHQRARHVRDASLRHDDGAERLRAFRRLRRHRSDRLSRECTLSCHCHSRYGENEGH